MIVLTNFARAGYWRRALQAELSGYVLKAQAASERAEALRKMHQDLRVIDPKLPAEYWNGE